MHKYPSEYFYLIAFLIKHIKNALNLTISLQAVQAWLSGTRAHYDSLATNLHSSTAIYNKKNADTVPHYKSLRDYISQFRSGIIQLAQGTTHEAFD